VLCRDGCLCQPGHFKQNWLADPLKQHFQTHRLEGTSQQSSDDVLQRSGPDPTLAESVLAFADVPLRPGSNWNNTVID
jgi:hypothetical protein